VNCPLCFHTGTFYYEDKKRSYLQCPNCQLVYVPEEFILSQKDEKSEYDLHENDPFDPGYRKFLGRVFTPITTMLETPANGLDFGCGPGPALFHMFTEAGYTMSLYDYYYYPDKSTLNQQYDFITCTEVIEHVTEPNPVFKTLFNCIREKGVLGIMTKLVQNKEAFSQWHYKNDPTHIRFYSKETFEYIAKEFTKKIEFKNKDVILFS
jgi:SAM-dependent methyltransferase